jgi:hypothetical protein
MSHSLRHRPTTALQSIPHVVCHSLNTDQALLAFLRLNRQRAIIERGTIYKQKTGRGEYPDPVFC